MGPWDSLLDFYVGYPGAKDFTFLDGLYQDPNLRVQGLFYNQIGMKFASQNLPELKPMNLSRLTVNQKLSPFRHGGRL